MGFSLTFTDQQMVYLQIAINELPEKPRGELVNSINSQIAGQQKQPSTGPASDQRDSERGCQEDSANV